MRSPRPVNTTVRRHEISLTSARTRARRVQWTCDLGSVKLSLQEQFRAVVGNPSPAVQKKEISTLDSHARACIERSPCLLIGTAGADGRMDVSPKGDPPGFVQVLDEATPAIPDRLGDRRADTFKKRETLRVSGRASLFVISRSANEWRSEKSSRTLRSSLQSIKCSFTVRNALFVQTLGSRKLGRTSPVFHHSLRPWFPQENWTGHRRSCRP